MVVCEGVLLVVLKFPTFNLLDEGVLLSERFPNKKLGLPSLYELRGDLKFLSNYLNILVSPVGVT